MLAMMMTFYDELSSSSSILDEALRLASAPSGDGLLRPDFFFFSDFFDFLE
jgi:hypothetical protein